MQNQLKVKDFISIGIFAAIYIVGFMVFVTLLGFIPILYFFSVAVNAFLLAPIFMLFVARVPKKNAILILGFIVSCIFALMMPRFWPIYVVPIIVIISSELFARKARFKDFRFLTASYICFSMWAIGIFSSFWLFKDQFFERTASYGYETSYIDAMRALIQPHIFFLILATTFFAAIAGSFLAKRLLDKHFKKAGII